MESSTIVLVREVGMPKFNVGQEFSLDPSGRFESDNNRNGNDGSSFREQYLREKIKSLGQGERLTVILDDGVESYGSSFLTESFAGMVKFGYIKAPQLLEKLDFEYTDEDFLFYENKIIQYIGEALYNSSTYDPNKTSD
jgi:hypothetical protein